uniref:SJCHGC07245 protein n=1 Tax=Schistosoma japonicum TaxID=6182 RepID=Q5BRV7_SCHJA|nr:SJCHGC07245 protein [Schistosoma japonicum]
MDEINANLFNLVTSLIPESSLSKIPESPMPLIFGLSSNWPTKVDLRTSLKFKGVSEEVCIILHSETKLYLYVYITCIIRFST